MTMTNKNMIKKIRKNGRAERLSAPLFFLLFIIAFFFLVTSASAFSGYLTLDSFSGTPGSVITVSGGGWKAGDSVSIFESSPSGSPKTTATVTATGEFKTNLIISSNSPTGPLRILGVDSSTNDQADNSYYVVPLSPELSFTATAQTPWSAISVSGKGFAPNEIVDVSFPNSAPVKISADSKGSFSNTSLTVPQVPSGIYILTGHGESSSAEGRAYFWVDAFYPYAYPSLYYILPGEKLSFSGGGYASAETIKIEEKNQGTMGNFTAKADGTFGAAGSISIPANMQGKTLVFNLSGEKSGQTVSVPVSVGILYSYAYPSSYYLLPGEKISWTGGGFFPNEKISILRGGEKIAEFSANTTGSFKDSGQTPVPWVSGGSISYNLRGNESGAETTVSIGVGSFNPILSPDAYFVTPGNTISLSGSGFAAKEKIGITVAGMSSQATTTDSNGSFKITGLEIPFADGDTIRVEAVGELSHVPAVLSLNLAKFQPLVSPNIYFFSPGQSFSFIGSGFAPQETITVQANGFGTKTLTSDASGHLPSNTFTVPWNSAQTVTFSFLGNKSKVPAGASINIGALLPLLTTDSYFINPGGNVRVSGSGFGPMEKISVTAGSWSTTTETGKTGTTTAITVPIPWDAKNSVQIVMTGEQSQAQASINIGIASLLQTLVPSTYYAPAGSTIKISGSGFIPTETVSGTLNNADIGNTTVTAIGTFEKTITLPFNATTAHFTFTGNSSRTQLSVDVTIASLSPVVVADSYYVAPGSKVTISGSGFAGGETVHINQNGSDLTTTTDTNGNFTAPISLPYGNINGNISISGEKSGAKATLSLGIAQYTAGISLDNYYGQAGSPLKVNGYGFAANEKITVTLGTSNLTATTDTSGNFSLATQVPYMKSGTLTIQAKGEKSGASANASYTVAEVYGWIYFGSYAGTSGSTLNIFGGGFLPNEPLEITTDRTGTTKLATFSTASTGAVNGSVVIPSNLSEGNLNVTVTGTHSFVSKTITFYVTK